MCMCGSHGACTVSLPTPDRGGIAVQEHHRVALSGIYARHPDLPRVVPHQLPLNARPDDISSLSLQGPGVVATLGSRFCADLTSRFQRLNSRVPPDAVLSMLAVLSFQANRLYLAAHKSRRHDRFGTHMVPDPTLGLAMSNSGRTSAALQSGRNRPSVQPTGPAGPASRWPRLLVRLPPSGGAWLTAAPASMICG